jgi:hypothetical protein
MEYVTTGDSLVANTTTLSLDAARLRSRPASEKESAVRVALEASAGRTLSDLEWDRARSRLMDFVSTLRDWHRKNTTIAPELPKAA